MLTQSANSTKHLEATDGLEQEGVELTWFPRVWAPWEHISVMVVLIQNICVSIEKKIALS
eukprot:m.196277 g.196277  ORF g.196277 m.196277 type:complete len:60 (-) comp15250_c1_seq2:108-287(-)